MTSQKRNMTLGIVAAGLLVGGAVWGLSRSSNAEPTTLPQELSVASLKAQLADPEKSGEAMRNTFERTDLTDEQRQELRGNMRQVMQSMMDERIDEYYRASEEDKVAVLNKHIDDMQAWMKEWQERREQREKERKERGEAEPTPEEREARWREREGSQTQAQRKERSESRSPDDMARRMAYFGAVQQRMAQRGIQMPFGPGGGRGGPGGGRWGGGGG